MRWLFLIMLSLNLIYIAWQMLTPEKNLYAEIKPLKDVPPIVLLSELKTKNEIAAMAAQKKVASSVTETEKTTVEIIAAVSEAKQRLKADKKSAAGTAGKTTDKVKGKDVTDVKTATVKAKPVKTVTASISQSSSCYTLGPFRNLINLSSLTQDIKSYVVEADFRGREESEQSLYWVYVNPEKNRKAAISTGKRLKAKKVKDFYLIREGEKIHGISLGHFRNKSGAYGLAKKVQKLGFDVQVEPVFKTYTVYWLDYQLASGVSIPESIFDKQIKRNLCII